MFLIPPPLLPPFVRPLQLGVGFALGWILRSSSECGSASKEQESKQ
jgi:hypothetical protein